MRALTLLLISVSFCLAKKPVTLADIGGGGGRGGFAAGMPAAWHSDGKSFLYREGRKLMQYDVTARTSREVANTDALATMAAPLTPEETFQWENRRVREFGVQYFPNGKDMLVSSGGDIFIWMADDAKWKQVTKTPVPEHDPKLSPDGTRVSFRRGWDLYVIELATGKETRLTKGGKETLRNGGLDWVYPEEIGLSTAHWWSPDSKSIAYLQFDISDEPIYPHADLLKSRAVAEPQRYPQAGENNADVHLGVVSVNGGNTQWLDVGDTRRRWVIARVGFFPDGRVYAQRVVRNQTKRELLTFDKVTGESRALITEIDPYWINVRDDVRFLKDGKRFLWQSERDGFNHVYLYDLATMSPKQITRGKWEVSALNAVDEDKGVLYVTTTEVAVTERHLFAVPMSGGAGKQLTKGAGTHAIAMAPDGGYYLDTFSSLTSPSETTLHSADGAKLSVYRAADKKQEDDFEILPTELHQLKAADGTVLYGRLIRPVNFDASKKYPAIVQVYGGPHAQNVTNRWAGLGIDQVYAHKGFVIWQVDNRGTFGRGHAFESAVFRQLGKIELEDQKKGVEYLIGLGFVDAARIGVNGWSYGGFMTLNCLLNAPDVFHAGIAGAPVTDWNYYDTIYTERYMGLPSENVEGYKATALPQRAGNLKGKLLLIHNIDDDNVLFMNGLQMSDALQRAGKQFEMMLYPQKAH
ncbi:MAG: S9 family peptidase, partial [Bryobacteraceae bacterium]